MVLRILFVISALLLELLWVPPVLQGQELRQEHKENVKVISRKQDTGVRVTSENKNPFTITLMMRELLGENVNTSREIPFREVIPPNSTRPLFSITIADKKKAFSYKFNYSWVMGKLNATHNDGYIYRLPYRDGRKFSVGQAYDGSFSHNGKMRYAVDFTMEEGTEVVAAREGIVAITIEKYSEGGQEDHFRDKSNVVIIEHSDGTFAEYVHLKQNGALVKPGDRVHRGRVIGYSGNTGFSSGPHLHFMVFKTLPDGSHRSLPVKVKTSEGMVTGFEVGETYTSY